MSCYPGGVTLYAHFQRELGLSFWCARFKLCQEALENSVSFTSVEVVRAPNICSGS